MKDYLGETIITNLSGTPYVGYTKSDWALKFVEMYGQIDGTHHKAWVLDQVARILNDTPVIVSLAEWANGDREYRFNISKNTSSKYQEWVKDMLGEITDEYEDDGETFYEYEYSYEEGVAP